MKYMEFNKTKQFYELQYELYKYKYQYKNSI